jgi:hypothetical protein
MDKSAQEGSRNCACAVGAGLVEWATRGTRAPTHHEFRIAAGDPRDSNNDPRGLSSAEVKDAYKSFGVDVTRRFGAPFAEVRQALADGHAISACVDYGTINDEAPELSGQRTFRTGHHLALLGFTPNDPRTGGFNSTIVHDPLFDGRTKGWGTAPLGPQLSRLRVYRDAMGAFRVNGPTYSKGHPIGDDMAVFLIVRRAPAPAGAVAAAGPVFTDAQVADLRARLEEAEKQIADLKVQLGVG